MDDTTQSPNSLGDPLALWLTSRLSAWEQSRKPQEQKMLECYQDVMRIARDTDTAGTGASKARKAKSLFIGSTRNKVRAARAKINDALFGAGKMPFDTEPTNEQLAPFADALEDILIEQMRRGKFKETIKTGVNTLATYGTGFIFGPFVKREEIVETSVDNSYGIPQIQESKFGFDLPYFELGNTLDVYPDPDAKDADDGTGIFWVSHLSPYTIADWAQDKSYQNVPDALKCIESQRSSEGSDLAEQLRANNAYWTKGGRIKVARYFGRVPKSYLNAPAADAQPDTETAASADDVSPLDYVEAVIIMAGGVVVKASESPYSKRPAMRSLYESVEHEMWGVGVAENNAPHQKTVNAAFRLFMDGKGMALLGTKSVDRSKFMPTEDFVKYPGKVYAFKPGLTPDDRKSAIIDHVEPDITAGWLDVIRMSEQYSDDDTGITKYTQGDDASHLNKTATGISMIMNASSLPIKEVLDNIDHYWIEPMIDALIAWNLKYLDVETVRKIHGDDIAKNWQAIKEFGKSSFMTWKATGAQTFVQKEILAQKLQQFMSIAMSNPALAQLVDPRELLVQVWEAMQIGRESPIKKDDQHGGAPQAQELQAHLEQMTQQLQALGEEYNKLHDERDAQREQRLIERYNAETNRLKLLLPALGPQTIAAVAQEFGIQVLDSPDIYPGDGQEAPQEPPQSPTQPSAPSEAMQPPVAPPEQPQQPIEPPQEPVNG
jgi:hypothetical protein